jgi:hypothetical protein
MAINSITSTVSILDIQSITSTSTQQPIAGDPSAATNGVAVDISKPGQLMGQLDSLAQSDPDKFKAVTADIAQKLKDAASSQTGARADFLSKLADRFSTASESGNASDLNPGAGKPHGGHHGGGHHRVHATGTADQPGATGAGPDDSMGQLIQGIISSALGTTSATAAAAPAASSPST